ncbi:MAG: phosphoribosylanthranilate isomerase [bacterium]|nr:phosphoribosylanthranilate isomerase [bacterium]
MAIWVKICGITQAEDAEAAFAAGADAIGLNFIGGPRQLTVDAARRILDTLGDRPEVVALVDLSEHGFVPDVARLLEDYRIRRVQLYGDVTPPNVARLLDGHYGPLVVARLDPGDPEDGLTSAMNGLPADRLFALVLDAHVVGIQGGTGRTLEWPAVASALRGGGLAEQIPIVLAGGLNPGNVRQAVKIVRPWGVDVSSGVERRPGVKDHAALARFIRQAKDVDEDRDENDG